MNTTPSPKEIPISDACSHLSKIANEVAYAGKRAILTQKGKRLVAIVPIKDLEAFETIENRVDLEDAREALADIKKKGSISWDPIKNKLDK